MNIYCALLVLLHASTNVDGQLTRHAKICSSLADRQKCKNNSTCYEFGIDDENEVYCNCLAEWTGPGCEMEKECPQSKVKECSEDDNKECTLSRPSQNSLSYVCVKKACGEDQIYNGNQCARLNRKDRCWFYDECDQFCWESGIRVCECMKGYTKNIRKCEDIDECVKTSEHFGGCTQNCTNTIGSYFCSCKADYTNTTSDSKVCAKINDCIGHNCTNKGTCVDGIATFSCECLPQWMGKWCETDVDECKETHECDNKTTVCSNTAPGYECQCRDPNRFELDSTKRSCKLRDLCKNSPCQNGGTCEMAAGGDITCLCPAGYTDAHCETDVNECEMSMCVNGECINNAGSFTCTCPLGHILADGSCNNVDECENRDACDAQHGECEDTEGSYQCFCVDGYEGESESNIKCVNIDECKTNKHNCSHNCTDTDGSFRCECNEGFQGQTAENLQCVDIKECNIDALNKCDENTTDCTNSAGSYECQCKLGYLRISPVKCSDINECSEGTASCIKSTSACVNTMGSFECECHNGGAMKGDDCHICNTGYFGESCEKACHCEDDAACDKESGVCLADTGCDDGYEGDTCSTPKKCGTHKYGPECNRVCFCHSGKCDINSGHCEEESCKPGWTGDKCDVFSSNGCNAHKCASGATCIDLPQNYLCLCAPGFTGFFCDEQIQSCLKSPCGKKKNCTEISNGYQCKAMKGLGNKLQKSSGSVEQASKESGSRCADVALIVILTVITLTQTCIR